MLRSAGAKGEILGACPVPKFAKREDSGIIVLDEEDFKRFTKGLPTKHCNERPAAIQLWLDEHPETKKFVILDDTGYMGHLYDRHIRTVMSVGLTRENADLAIRMLKYPAGCLSK